MSSRPTHPDINGPEGSIEDMLLGRIVTGASAAHVDCPKCSAPPSRTCVTASGYPARTHAGRFTAAGLVENSDTRERAYNDFRRSQAIARQERFQKAGASLRENLAHPAPEQVAEASGREDRAKAIFEMAKQMPADNKLYPKPPKTGEFLAATPSAQTDRAEAQDAAVVGLLGLEAVISEADVIRVHGYANFGSMTPREVVNDGVRKYAVGYSGGHTQLCILMEHGLITKPRPGRYDASLTKKGKQYARALWRFDEAEAASVIRSLQAEAETLDRDIDSISKQAWDANDRAERAEAERDALRGAFYDLIADARKWEEEGDEDGFHYELHFGQHSLLPLMKALGVDCLSYPIEADGEIFSGTETPAEALYRASNAALAMQGGSDG